MKTPAESLTQRGEGAPLYSSLLYEAKAAGKDRILVPHGERRRFRRLAEPAFDVGVRFLDPAEAEVLLSPSGA